MPWTGLVQRQLLRNSCEEVPHVLGSLGRSLEEQQACLASVSLRLTGRNGPLVGLLGDKVEFVSGQRDDDVLVGLALELFDPCLRLVQR